MENQAKRLKLENKSNVNTIGHCAVEDDEESNGRGSSDSRCSTPEEGCTSGLSPVKYKLRPRSYKSRYLYDPDWSLPETPGPKTRPPPLSRYRRKTANARERCRMRQINTAFDSLRGVLPAWVCRRRAAADMTKITTLRLASAYIRSLQDMLDGNAPQDECAWVLSGLFNEDTESKDTHTPVSHHNTVSEKDHKQQQQQQQNQQQEQQPSSYSQDQDLVTLLCGAADSGLFQDSLEALPYLTPSGDTDVFNFSLSCDTPRPWQQQHTQHATLAT